MICVCCYLRTSSSLSGNAAVSDRAAIPCTPCAGAAATYCKAKGDDMYLSPRASLARQREAQKARDNRAEIVRALSQGQVTRRDLYKWGIFTTTGALALKNGLSPFATSAFAAVPTGTPRSPLFL